MLVIYFFCKIAVISVDIVVNDATGTTLSMDKGQTFTTSVNGTTYNYITNEDLTISLLMVYLNFQMFLYTKVHKQHLDIRLTNKT